MLFAGNLPDLPAAYQPSAGETSYSLLCLYLFSKSGNKTTTTNSSQNISVELYTSPNEVSLTL